MRTGNFVLNLLQVTVEKFGFYESLNKPRRNK